MVSFVHLTIFFLAGVSLVVSIPSSNLRESGDEDSAKEEAGEDVTNGEEDVDLSDPNAVNVLDAVSSIAELSADQRKALRAPLARLVRNFDGTLFGSLFAYISKRLENPTEFAASASEPNDAELFKKTPLALKSFISTLQKLSDKVIDDSQPQFDEILEILGDAKFAILFREILMTLKMRRVLFQYAKGGDAILENLPSMLADADKFDMKKVQRLMGNPAAVAAALMPNAVQTQKYDGPAQVRPPKAADSGKLGSSLTNVTPHPIEVVNAAKNVSGRVRLNGKPVSKVGVPTATSTISSIQQRMQQNLPPYRPAILENTSRNTMMV